VNNFFRAKYSVHSIIRNISQKINQLNRLIGQSVAWCSLLLVLLVFVIAVLRYVFKFGSISMQEIVIYLHGMIFMLGASYTLADDEHVRVDVFYARFSNSMRAWINLLGCTLFLLPMCWFIYSNSFNYVAQSWQIGETSSEAGGLPYLFLLKSLLLAMPVLLATQGLAVILKSLLIITGGSKTDA
jgi:TRAP-type mannitol/chloroaromatic compound transport system permease small subunit